MIALEDVSLGFGDVTVLDGIDATVEGGEFVGLVGPNGAGKTTLLRCINGIFEPDSGTVRIDGTPGEEYSSKALSRKVATVPQDTHLGFSFTAEQIVEMGRTPHRSRLDWRDEHGPVEAAMEQTETLALRDRTVDELSGGERQRVLLARALAQEPDVFLLDEPTASLDINHQVQVLSLVEKLVGEKSVAIAAIHDLDLAARFCDRLMLLHDGTIRAQGPPELVLGGNHLDEAFNVETAITHNPVTGTPTVVAVSDRPTPHGRVHVVGSGPGARVAIRTLWEAGYDVTLGLVPEGDVAAQLGTELGIEMVTAPAFSQPDECLQTDVTELVQPADVLVETAGPETNVQPTVEDVPRIHADLGGGGPRTARVDGGANTLVDNEDELRAAVRDLLQ